MSWKVAEAKQKLSEVIRRAQLEPQLIYKRDQLVAAVVDAEALRQLEGFQRSSDKPTLAESIARVRALCSEANYDLEIPTRQDRPNDFAAALDEIPL